MEESPTEVSEIKQAPKRPAWWCWPLILLSLIPYDSIIVSLLPDEKKEQVELAESQEGSAALALFKLQSQVIIGSHEFDPRSAEEALEQLEKEVSGDKSRAAYLLIDRFIREENEDRAEIIERISSENLKELVSKAVDSGLTEEERDQMDQQIGWFAKLAPASGGGQAPEAESIQTTALLTLVAIAILFLLGLCCLVGGAILLIFHVSRVSAGRAKNAFEPHAWNSGVLLESFALYLGIMTLGALLAGFLGTGFAIAGYGLAVVIPLIWPLFRGYTWSEFAKAIGWHRGKGVWREVGAGFVGYMGVLSVASIGIAITLVLSLVAQFFVSASPEGGGAGGSGPSVGPNAHPIVGWMYEGDFLVQVACLFLAAGFAPFFEETFFRGALHRYLRGKMNFIVAALLGGLIFAALHPQGFFAIPALGAMAVGFAIVREWRDSLIAPMVAHAINNGVLVGILWLLL